MAKETELRDSNTTLMNLYNASIEARRKHTDAVAAAAAVGSGEHRNVGIAARNKAAREAYYASRAELAYKNALTPLIRTFKMSVEREINRLSYDSAFQAFRKNRQDLYDARQAANVAYTNKRKALLRDPIYADRLKEVALARYNYQNACKGNIEIATSIPFTYQLFGIIF